MRRLAIAALGLWCAAVIGQEASPTGLIRTGPPVPEKQGPLRKALLLLRQDKTGEARAELSRLLKSGADDPEIYFQLARSHLSEFYRTQDPARRRVSLSLAMEALGSTLRRNPDHINALKTKSVIHARAELLYYDPNLAYEMAARVAKLEPHAHEYLVGLSEWLGGEVRFTAESEHRVPHDPQLGLDRAIDLLEEVVDGAMPFSAQEAAALFQMGKALSRRGNFGAATDYFRQALSRAGSAGQRVEALQEMGTSYYRLGDFNEAARHFYEATQVINNSIGQWLLRVALDQIKGQPPPLPASVMFPMAEPAIDPANPPLLKFENMAKELGVNRLDGNGTCAWADYDGDGKLDLALAGSGTFMALYRNEGARFRDVTREAGLEKVPSGYSLNFIDYDNDGRPDLYISMNGWNGPMRNRLFHNAGNGRFDDVSRASGAGDPGSGFVSVWGDLDNDGFLDFVVANGVLKDGSTPQIYRNNGPVGGNVTFTNMTKAAGIDEPPQYGAIGAALGDYDRDGDLDILINGLGSAPNRLYRNDGKWRFKEVSREAGVVQPPHNGFVCFFVDYNNDGWPDILTTSLAPWPAVVEGLKKGFSVASRQALHPDTVRLFRNNGSGKFTDVTLEARLFYPMGVMGAGVADVDNDGFIDFYFGTGDPQLTRLEPNRFFRNNGDGTFSDLTRYVGFERPGNKGHGVTFIDVDEDGDLDIYAQLGGHYAGDHAENAFYRNLLASRNHWLQIDLLGTRSNRSAVGAAIEAKVGGLTMFREVKGGEGFGATNPARVHFGLGKHEKLDSLEIFWPGGKRQKIEGVSANQILKVKE
ncbi:MAG: FG-GAP-like repeat-containing protein [Bryobacteraceae bacterium]